MSEDFDKLLHDLGLDDNSIISSKLNSRRESSNKWAKNNRCKKNELNRKYYAITKKDNPEKLIDKKKQWRKNNPEKYKKQCDRTRYKKTYGITLDQYNEMVLLREGKCEICGVKPKYRNLDLDHCHNTGKIRGLLCSNCNGAIGMLKDSIDIVIKVHNYLLKYSK